MRSGDGFLFGFQVESAFSVTGNTILFIAVNMHRLPLVRFRLRYRGGYSTLIGIPRAGRVYIPSRCM
jgi:hypothetical protein